VLAAAMALSVPAEAACKGVQKGGLTDVNGNPISLGFDKWGYNYQAHMFNGLYDNFSRPSPVVTEGLDNLVMKWSDDWLANVDCNGDGKLDRGGPGGDGTSKGWLTNHFEGDYLGADNEYHHYTEYFKIVYVGPAISPDPWAASRIWDLYAIIEHVYNDSYAGAHGVDRASLVNPAGLGYWTK
jgi:hypothetical protein